ncbi:MAG TPA: hypothetical protein VHC04_02720 [Rhodopila sp.]|nr:hypothetical protein [Rhodopila sp.]
MLLSVVIGLLAFATLVWLTGHHAIIDAPFDRNEWVAFGLAFVLASMVGACELISRYRDNPWMAACSPPGLCYIGANGAAGMIALYFIRHIGPSTFGLKDNLIDLAFLSGFGAMVIIRTKLFTLRQPGGTDVAVGPAFAVDTFLAAVNREVDRRRARIRTQVVAEWSRRLRDYDFKDALPIMTGGVSAFQDLDPAYAARLKDVLKALQDDQQFKDYSSEAKFFWIGFDIMTVFGDKPFETLFSELEQYLIPRKGVPPRSP